jgi:protoporphyrinogen oxidase
MAQIPQQLAAQLAPGTLELERRVQRLSAGPGGPGVVLDDGALRSAKALVVATPAREAGRLLTSAEGNREPGRAVATRGTTCFYFSAPQAPIEGPYLVLDGNGQGPINSLLCPSSLSDAYAPAGQTLVTVNCFGHERLPESLLPEVMQQLRDWFGESVDGWRQIAVYRIEDALPAQYPPVTAPDAASGLQPVAENLWVCGELSAPPSIHWALASGRLAGEAIARGMHGHRP